METKKKKGRGEKNLFPAMLYAHDFLPASLAIIGIAGKAVCTRKTVAVL